MSHVIVDTRRVGGHQGGVQVGRASLPARESVGRLLLLATYPYPNGPASARIAGVVRDLRGHGVLRMIEPGSFDESDVWAYLAHRLRAAPSPSIVAHLVDRSRGNPLRLARLVEHSGG